MKHLVYFLAWLVCYVLTVGMLLADLQGEFPSLACERYRKDLGFSVLISLAPPTLVVAPFLTGFAEHGLQYFPLKRCRKEQSK